MNRTYVVPECILLQIVTILYFVVFFFWNIVLSFMSAFNKISRFPHFHMYENNMWLFFFVLAVVDPLLGLWQLFTHSAFYLAACTSWTSVRPLLPVKWKLNLKVYATFRCNLLWGFISTTVFLIFSKFLFAQFYFLT